MTSSVASLIAQAFRIGDSLFSARMLESIQSVCGLLYSPCREETTGPVIPYLIVDGVTGGDRTPTSGHRAMDALQQRGVPA